MGESSSKENTLSTRKFFIVVKKIFFNIKLIPARIKDFCIKIKTFFNEFPERTNSRSDLTSTNIFVRMLKTAIHDKNVQTIALLGDFSSGKSSILFSSLKKKRTLYVYPTNDFYEKTDIDTKKKIFLRSLVKSDIASISKNQDTYRHYIRGKKLIKLYTIAIVIWIILTIPLTYLFIKFSDIIKNFMSNNLHIEINDNLFTFIPTIICGGILVLVLIFYTLYICNYHIILKLNNVTIDSKDKTTDESVFTTITFHLIRRKIKYVVFEDLDRKTNKFNYGLFRELRDFCLRINSSPQIKKPIKFIYCFSDSIFRVSDERLKSFDYIIPIFPKITMNNSYDELIRQDIIIEKQIDKNELSDLSIFITNQRLYNAIILEFRVMCSEIKSSNYNEIFALCCIKNIYPIIYNKLLSNNNFYDEIIVGMNGDINKFESASKDLTTKIRDIFQSLNQKSIDGTQNNTENDDFLKTIVNDATLLIKICILNKYLTSNYKNYIHGGTNFLSSNDRNYLKNIAAMEKVDPNIELTNFEVVLKSAKNLSNPKFFNISLLKYCLENQRKESLKDIINSLKFKESYEAIDSIVESNKFNSSNIKYLSKQLYKEPFYIENILQINDNYYINAMLTEYLQNKIINRNFTSGMAEDKIKYFYYQYPDYFAKLNVQLKMYILQTYAEKFNKIPTINDNDTRQKIYDLIVKNKRYEINLINLNHIFENFENSPLKCILGNTIVYGYIRESNRLDIIKDLNPGEDSIQDLITLLQSGNDVTKLIDSKYIKQFSHSIDIDTTYSNTLISKLIDFNLIKFSDYNILQCSSKFGNSKELIKFISNSIKDGSAYELKDNKKFNTTLSTYLITELSVAELSVIKESIDASIFNNAFNNAINLGKIAIGKVKLFEKQIILTRPVIITFVDNNNLSLLKDILNACQAIKIDKSGHSADSIRLNKVKKLGLRRLYGLFKD